MKKLAALAAAGAILLSVTAVFASQPPMGEKGLKGQAGKSNVAFIELWEKDPSTWEIVEDGAWGKMAFKDDSFVFNGHGLETDIEYTLIRYTDPWPGTPLACLGSGTSVNGDIHLSGDMQDGGPKVWLVLSDDVDCVTGMTDWSPAEYLFEYDLIP